MDNQKNTFSENNFNSDSNSELDILFKNALQNHSVPTEDHIWRRIQHGLVDKKDDKPLPITKSISKATSYSIWTAVSGIAASLLIWGLFFNSSTPTNSLPSTNSVATSSKTETEIKTKLDNTNTITNKENKVASTIFENKEKNNNTDATSSNLIASKKQIPPTITLKHTSSKTKNPIADRHIKEAVANLEKDQTQIKTKQVQDNYSKNPSTLIAQNVWASDFVVQNKTVSTSKNPTNTETHQLNIDNQTVAITIKVGRNEVQNEETSQATGLEQNATPSQFDKAKTVLREVWNLKTGKKVNLQNILPNNENEQTNQPATKTYAD